MTARVRTNERAATVPASRSHGFRNPSPIVRVLMLLGLAVWSWGQTPVAHAVSESSEQPPLRSPINPFGTVEEFPAVEARYVRMVIIHSSLGEPCIDEFQVFSADTPARNVALASGGAKASASGLLRAEFSPDHVHDGRHDGNLTWIANERTNAWLELELPKVQRINRIVWSRDGTGAYSDRVPIEYRIEVATERSAWMPVASSGDHLPLPDLLELPPRDPRALPREYLLQARSEEEAFPHSRVNDIAQTPDGYLWLATEQGLVRFDGDQFTVFSAGNTAQLVDGEVRSVHVDRGGRLVLGTTDPGHPFVVYERGRFSPLDLPDPSLSFLFEDDDGVPWGVGKEGLFPWRNGRYDRTAGLGEFRHGWPISIGAAAGPDGTV